LIYLSTPIGKVRIARCRFLGRPDCEGAAARARCRDRGAGQDAGADQTAGDSGGCEGEFGLYIVVFDAGFGFIGCFGIETVEKSVKLEVFKGGFEGEM
jgi:hypothetical protein